MGMVMVIGRGGEGPVNGNNDTELVSVMCAAASTITPAPVLAWTPGFYYFGIVKRSIVGRGPAAGCLNGAASRGQGPTLVWWN